MDNLIRLGTNDYGIEDGLRFLELLDLWNINLIVEITKEGKKEQLMERVLKLCKGKYYTLDNITVFLLLSGTFLMLLQYLSYNWL